MLKINRKIKAGEQNEFKNKLGQNPF